MCRRRGVWSCLMVSVLLAGCTAEPATHRPKVRKLEVPRSHGGSYPIRAVCTTGMVADLVRNIGGARVTVDQLFGQDVDPHLYKATPADINKLNGADAIFYSGLHLEGKMAELLERIGRRSPVFPVAEYIDTKLLLTDEHGNADPHVWFDVSLWSQAAGFVRDALCLYDPEHAAEYRQRGEKYLAELGRLHEEARVELAGIPKEQRVLITSHDAFRYFGRAYDVEVKGIQGISTEAEASVRDINELVAFIARRKVKAVFVESSVSKRNMESLMEGCRKHGHEVKLGGELFSDAMGPAGTPEGTYAGMVRHNVATSVKALR
jgi:manganese/zinc/iron transport system substrate-binding protein